MTLDSLAVEFKSLHFENDSGEEQEGMQKALFIVIF